jgi:hypothetical protein
MHRVAAAALCALSLATFACGSKPDWGPLAVVDDGFGPDALASGTLRIDPDCVYLESPSARYLLVWPSDRTSWNEPEDSISFQSRDGVVTLDGGQHVSLGGGEGPAGLPPWLASPRPACAGTLWFVQDVVAD